MMHIYNVGLVYECKYFAAFKIIRFPADTDSIISGYKKGWFYDGQNGIPIIPFTLASPIPYLPSATGAGFRFYGTFMATSRAELSGTLWNPAAEPSGPAMVLLSRVFREGEPIKVKTLTTYGA